MNKPYTANPYEAWPDVDEDLVDFLEEAFPPLCYTGTNLEGHLMYAGKVELVAVLRDVVKTRQLEGDPEARLIVDDVAFLRPHSGG